jgi:hypothetical protein
MTEPTRDYAKIEPEILDADMTRADLAFALRHLNFSRKGFAPLKIDREVARFLVNALRRD